MNMTKVWLCQAKQSIWRNVYYIYVYIYTYVYIYIYMYVYICIYISIYICIYISIYIGLCVCVCVCVYICVDIYVVCVINLWTVAAWLFDGLSDKLTLGRPEGSYWEYGDIICPRFCLLSYVIEHIILGWLFPNKKALKILKI